MSEISTVFSENLIKKMDERGGVRPEAIERDLNRLYVLELCTLDELKGRFTEDEIKFLWLNAIQGLEYGPMTDPKTEIMNNIATALDKNACDVLLSNTKDTEKVLAERELNYQKELRNSLLEKLNGLTSFQAYTLYAVLNNLTQGKVVDMETMYRAFR